MSERTPAQWVLLGAACLLAAIAAMGLVGRRNVVSIGRFTVSHEPGQAEQESNALRDIFADRLREMKAQAATARIKGAVQVGGAAVVPDFEVAGQKVALGSVLQFVRENIWGAPVSISGDIVFSGQSVKVNVRVENAPYAMSPVTVTAPRDEVYAAVEAAATQSLLILSPFELASYYFSTGREQDALDAVKYAIRHPPSEDDPWAYNLWAVMLIRKGDYEGALTRCRRAIEMDPLFAPALVNWGVALEDLGRVNEAIEKYRQAVRCQSQPNGSALMNLGNALRMRYETAANQAKRRKPPEQAPRADLVAALDAYRAATEAERLDPAAFDGLALTLLDLGQPANALEAANRAVDLGGGCGVCVNRGVILHSMEKFEAALGSYEHAAQEFPGCAAAYMYAADLLAADVWPHGPRVEEAIARYGKVRELEGDSALGQRAAAGIAQCRGAAK